MKRVLLDIWDGIRSQPGRTGLSFVAIGIGMVSLTILLAVIGGLRERSRQIIREIGANVFAILPQQSGATSETNDICESHAALVTANFPDCTVSVTRRFQAESPGIEGNVTVIATDENLARVRQWNLISGRFIDVRDMRTSDRVVVVSRALGNMRGWEIGHVVTLKNEPFTIIGIIDPQGDTVDSEQGTAFLSAGDKSAFVPITAAKLWMDPNHADYRNLDAIFVRVPETENFSRVLAAVKRLLSGPYDKNDRYAWITSDILLRSVRRLQAAIGFTVGSVALLCIILGGTTLMSLMVANVRDRITEIGLRRALGATPRDIASLFILEACLVTGTASLAGTVLTHVILFAARNQFPSPLHLDALTLLVPVCVSILLGIVFSYGPARMASRISPSESLRND